MFFALLRDVQRKLLIWRYNNNKNTNDPDMLFGFRPRDHLLQGTKITKSRVFCACAHFSLRPRAVLSSVLVPWTRNCAVISVLEHMNMDAVWTEAMSAHCARFQSMLPCIRYHLNLCVLFSRCLCTAGVSHGRLHGNTQLKRVWESQRHVTHQAMDAVRRVKRLSIEGNIGRASFQ